jgi:hypothetical protein
VLLLLCVPFGLAAGVTWAFAARDTEIRDCVLRTAEAVARDDIESVWDTICLESRTRFATSHAAVLKGLAWYRERAERDPNAAEMIVETEQEYRMSAEEILRSDPHSLWLRRTRQVLGFAGDRAAFGALSVERVESDGSRARVRARLPDNRPQGFHLVRDEGEWKLVDFQPYRDVEQAARIGKGSTAPSTGVPKATR